jgi:hypothetical protein
MMASYMEETGERQTLRPGAMLYWREMKKHGL